MKLKILFGAMLLVASMMTGHAALAYHASSGCFPPNTQITLKTPNAPTLHHPEVQLIFWGSGWSTQTSPSEVGLIANVQSLVNSPYFAALTQYANIDDSNQDLSIEAPRVAMKVAVSYTPFPGGGTTFTDCDINDMINSLISSGVVQAPYPGLDLIYLIFTPNGVLSAANPSERSACANYVGSNGVGAGQHQQCIAGSCLCTAGTCPNTMTYDFAWVTYGNTETASHELAETITDPAPSNSGGVILDYPPNCGTGNNPGCWEIGDACHCAGYNPNESQNGVTVQPYWSQKDHACVTPEGYGYTWSYNETPFQWTTITTTLMRQLYGAGGSESGIDLLTTDNSDNVWSYTPGHGFSEIGNSHGAIYAVSSTGPLAMKSDGTDILEYTSGSWGNLLFPRTDLRMLSVVSAAYPTVVVASGGIWQYVNGSWNVINDGMPTPDKVVGNSVALYVLAMDHQTILRYSEVSPVGWSTLPSLTEQIADIFTGGGGADLLGAVLTDPQRSIYTNQSAAGWVAVGNPSAAVQSYAIEGAEQLLTLTSNLANNPIQESNSPTNSGLGWTQIGNTDSFGGRLVGQGGNIYAATVWVY